MSNLNLNKVVLCGRLTADPEIKSTQNGIAVTSFSLAVNRRFAREENGTKVYDADFITCVAWRKTAEFIGKFFKKGSSLCITGSLQSRTWTDNEGSKHYATEVVIDEAMFVDSRSDNSSQANYVPAEYGAPTFASSDVPNFEEVKTDDDLPF